MQFFRKYFSNVDFDNTNMSNEVQLLCPFPHDEDKDGKPIFESKPSATINTESSLFYCFSCGKGLNEEQFISEIEGISHKYARELINQIDNEQDNWQLAIDNLHKNKSVLDKLLALGFSQKVIDELKIGFEGEGFSFPVFMYKTLLDVRTYNPGHKPKCKSRMGAMAGLIIPFDLWRLDKKATILCAGEKDMAICRSHGLNAITFTGGENTLPKMFKNSFKDKKIYICYDNDEAGKTGARKVAKFIFEAGGSPFIVDGHHAICKEKGEDIWDFFMKYKKDLKDLKEILRSTKAFSEEEYMQEMIKDTPNISLMQATDGKYRNKIVSSLVQVTSVFENQFSVADFVEFVKMADPKENSIFDFKGDKKTYSIEDYNINDILFLMEDDKISKGYYKQLAGIPSKETDVSFNKKSHITVFKANVIDFKESDIIENSETNSSLEMTAFIIGHKLQSGNKYRIKYKMVPHPLQKQELVLVVTDLQNANDTVSKFALKPEVVQSLKVFQKEENETVEDKMKEFLRRYKGITGGFAVDKIFFATDLFYHSPLKFNYANKPVRGYLDIMVIGETRTGKSATATALLKLYELGTFLSLKTATTVGLIGGSKQVKGSWKNTIGAIPRNHGGAVIMEEFQGAPENFIKSLTDIRSSNKVRILRADGELTVDSMVRMLTLSNQKATREGTKPLRSYPNGIEVIKELVEANEDIARYDFFVLVGEPEEYSNPFKEQGALTPFSKDSYQNRIRWVWSRKAEEIQFVDSSDEYIWNIAQELNKDFNCHIKIFGAEANLKLARLSVAVAGMLVSTSDDFTKILVRKEHVDWAANFLRELYNNELFRLKEYVEEQRRYSEIAEEDIGLVQDLYSKHTTLLTQLELVSHTTRNNLQAISGLERDDFSVVMNLLTQLLLIKWVGDKIMPSEKFRIAMSKINRTVSLKKIGL